MIIGIPWIDFILFAIMFGLLIYVLVANEISNLHKSYLAFHLLMMLWPLSQFIFHMSTVPSAKLTAMGVGLCSLLSLGPGWLLFAKLLTQQSFKWKSIYTVYLLLPICIAAITIGCWPELWFAEMNDNFTVDPFGLTFIVYIGFIALYFIPAIIVMIRALLHSQNRSSAYRKQIILLFSGILFFIVFALLDLFINVVRLDPRWALLGLTSMGILISDIFFVIVIQRYRALEITRIGRRDAIDTMSTGLMVLDEQDQILDLNRSMKTIFTEEIGSVLDIEAMLSHIPIPGEAERVLSLYRSDRRHTIETEIVLKHEISGSRTYVSLHISPIYDDKNNWVGRLLTFHDVSQLRSMVEEMNMKNYVLHERNQQLMRIQEELHLANRKLEHLAVTDPLTGCFNRRYLLEQMEIYTRQDYGSGIPFSLVMFDIDHFKSINDTYGHLVGDEVLIWITKCVRTLLHESDLLARYGGEEFAVFMPGVSFMEAHAFAERISTLLSESLTEEVFGYRIAVSVSVGIVSDESLPKIVAAQPILPWIMNVFDRVDQLMYQAKENGRNCIMPPLREHARSSSVNPFEIRNRSVTISEM